MKVDWKLEDIPDLNEKVIMITGANSGIGFEAAKALANSGAEVILASRNQDKAESALAAIEAEIPSAKVGFILLDLASLESIRRAVEKFQEQYTRLDVLLNNAGIMMVPFGLTEDGFEKQFGINHLGHFALTGLLIDHILNTPGARVVNISSNAHYGGEMDYSNLSYQKGDYTPMGAYSRSKLANLLFTYELQRRLEARGADALALAAHPGISATGLFDHFVNPGLAWLIRGILKGLFQNANMGALPGLRASVDPMVRGGEYYGPDGKGERKGYPVVVTSNPASHDLESAKKLWDISQDLTGVRYLSE